VAWGAAAARAALAATALLVALLCLKAAPAWAQGAAPGTLQPNAAPERPRIGLVLSGGGARGFAHVGVLKALEQAHVPIHAVVGTSMGAIIGGLYASGMDAAQLEQEILGVDWDTVFSTPLARSELSLRRKEQDFDFSPALQLGFKDGEFRFPQGAVSSQSLELLLRRYTLHTRHLDHFNALPIPFRAVATDMESGQPVVLDSGDLAAALRASMSVPGVFAPLEWNGRILGDGGLVNNLPVDVARSLGVDVVIAVNIGTPLAGRDTLGNVVGVTLQMINILTEQNVQRSVATLTPQDLLLSPPLGTLTSADFGRAEELVALGTRYADGVGASLARFALPPTEYAQWRAEREQATDTLLARLPQPLAFVRVEGVQGNRAERLQRLLQVQPGDTLSAEAIEQDLRRLNASEELLRLDYRLERIPGTGVGAGAGGVWAQRPPKGWCTCSAKTGWS
jgi:NTE family protein